jgi:redox-sensitive bicupin YhaK (pirin superfamily)
MIRIHDRDLRGRTRTGWLDGRHTFSFGHFMDPTRMGFRSLRVINDDHIIPGAGFGRHGHQDMEIITYILSGALKHQDSLGNGSVIRPGEIQKMSAGLGIEHAEFNGSDSEEVHLLQIWIIPDKKGLPPTYEQKILPSSPNVWHVIGDRTGGDHAVTIHQDAVLKMARLSEGKTLEHRFAKGRHGFVQIARGEVDLGSEKLKQGDGAEISGEDLITLTALTDSEILMFDLA